VQRAKLAWRLPASGLPCLTITLGEADGEAQEAFHLRGRAEKPFERLAARILEHQHGPTARGSGCRHRPGATLGGTPVRRPPTIPDRCHPDTGRSAKTASFVRLCRALGCIQQTRPLRVLEIVQSRARAYPHRARRQALRDQNTPNASTQGRPRHGSKPKSRLKVECHLPPDCVRCGRRYCSQIHAGVRALPASFVCAATICIRLWRFTRIFVRTRSIMRAVLAAVRFDTFFGDGQAKDGLAICH
jgi:hypothetical protein